MIRFLLRTIVSLLCFALLLAAIGSLFFWRHSQSNIDVIRFAHPKLGYFDAAFHKGQAQLSFVRRAEMTVKPAWLSRPITPGETLFHHNPLLLWDPTRVQDRQLPAGILHVKGNAEILNSLNPADAPRGIDIFASDTDNAPETAPVTHLRWTHSLVLPGWLLGAGLAVLPVLWALTGFVRRSRRRHAEPPAKAASDEDEQGSSRRPHF